MKWGGKCLFKEIKKFILLGTALTVLTTNFCSPLMHQGQTAPWYLALTSHLHMDYVTHFEKKKMEASLFKKKKGIWLWKLGISRWVAASQKKKIITVCFKILWTPHHHLSERRQRKRDRAWNWKRKKNPNFCECIGIQLTLFINTHIANVWQWSRHFSWVGSKN